MNKRLTALLITITVASMLFASTVTFSGGYSKVSLQDNNRTVTLSEGAVVDTGDFHITSTTIQLYGEDYRYVRCTGNVKVTETESSMTLSCSKLTYDRETSVLLSDGWIEVDDPEDGARLSGAWLEYNSETSTMKLQISASIEKDTDKGLLNCTSDTIEFNSEKNTLVLKGQSHVVWGDDTYSANIITVDIDNEEITLYDSISGEIHG